VSDLPAIAVTGAVALVASLGAVFLKEHFDRRRSERQRREAAYQRLATAVAVFLVRVEVARSDLSWRQSASESLMAFAPVVVAGLFSAVPKGWKKGMAGAVELAKLIRSPEPYMRSDQSYQAMIDALTVVVEARTELELVGSPPVLAEASKLIDACVSFADIARARPGHAEPVGGPGDEHCRSVGHNYSVRVNPGVEGQSPLRPTPGLTTPGWIRCTLGP
jgi:hypothetical protein